MSARLLSRSPRNENSQSAAPASIAPRATTPNTAIAMLKHAIAITASRGQRDAHNDRVTSRLGAEEQKKARTARASRAQ